VAELLVDTDVFVDHLRGSRELEPRGDTLAYSVVTRAELFAGPAEHEPVVRALLSALREYPVDREVSERAGRLRRDEGVPMADALIAATALQHGLSLMTRNRRHFERVPRLRLRAPR
jgi:predicted nucleic acid-binding protein